MELNRKPRCATFNFEIPKERQVEREGERGRERKKEYDDCDFTHSR